MRKLPHVVIDSPLRVPKAHGPPPIGKLSSVLAETSIGSQPGTVPDFLTTQSCRFNQRQPDLHYPLPQKASQLPIGVTILV